MLTSIALQIQEWKKSQLIVVDKTVASLIMVGTELVSTVSVAIVTLRFDNNCGSRN